MLITWLYLAFLLCQFDRKTWSPWKSETRQNSLFLSLWLKNHWNTSNAKLFFLILKKDGEGWNFGQIFIAVSVAYREIFPHFLCVHRAKKHAKSLQQDRVIRFFKCRYNKGENFCQVFLSVFLLENYPHFLRGHQDRKWGFSSPLCSSSCRLHECFLAGEPGTRTAGACLPICISYQASVRKPNTDSSKCKETVAASAVSELVYNPIPLLHTTYSCSSKTEYQHERQATSIFLNLRLSNSSLYAMTGYLLNHEDYRCQLITRPPLYGCCWHAVVG